MNSNEKSSFANDTFCRRHCCAAASNLQYLFVCLTSMSTTSTNRTERRRDATKRQIMGALKDDKNDEHSTASSSHKPAEFLYKSSIDGSNPSQVKLLIEDLREKVIQQQELLKTQAETGKKEQLGSFLCGMVKLSSRNKHQTVKEFNKEHNCNLLEILGNSGVGAAGKKRIRPNLELETPAPVISKKAQATPSRTVARGEAVL